MTQKERNLLVQDICARFPYGVIAKKEYTFVFTNGTTSKSKEIGKIDLEDIEYLISGDDCVDVLKPYLRPISSMTEEEKGELRDTYAWLYSEYPFEDEGEDEDDVGCHPEPSTETYDWYNRKMFDYRGLIQKGLAIEAPEGMYN